jgi:maltose alpha-D-glucosyltransferase / alpha-amylase
LILVIANLSRFSQATTVDLAEFDGLTPVDLFGRVSFPRISDHPYQFTFGPHTFFWFELKSME